MNEILRKLTSRKLWITIVTIVLGLAAMFGVSDNDIVEIVGALAIPTAAVSYVIGEAKVDAKRAESQSEGDGESE